MFTSGDIRLIRCQHALGDFTFSPKSNESYTLDPGGIRINDDANQISSTGRKIYQKNLVAWSFEGPVIVDFITDNEVLNLPKLSESSEEGIWTFEHISGVVYKGKGLPVGDLQVDTNTAIMTLKVSGSGKLEKL